MSRMPPDLERIARHVLDGLLAELGDDLLGLLLAGSAARGDLGPGGDLDLFALIRGDWRQRRGAVVDGVVVELFLNPVERVRREFEDAERPATLWAFAEGRPLYDPRGVVLALVQEARARLDQPPPPLSPAALARLRYALTDTLKDVQDLLRTDPEAAAYLMGVALDQAVEAHYRISRHWLPKPKYRIRQMRLWDCEAAEAVSACLRPGAAPGERLAALERLVDGVLAPAGGRLDFLVSEREPAGL
ncbi:MAG: hypothetical protein QJR08_02765 [Bacillota bacterium]|nr:hypothetical protein [Bacillota bacterium]